MLFGRLATGGQCDHVHRIVRRLQEGAALGGRPRKSWAASGRREEIERHLVLGSSLGPWAPDVFRSLKGSAGVYPWSLYLRGGLAALPLQGLEGCSSWARLWLALGLEGWETVGRPGEEIPAGRLGQSAREGGGTLTASPEAKGNLPRDPLRSAKQVGHLRGWLNPLLAGRGQA